VLFPDWVLGGVEPEAPTVAFAVVEDPFEDGLGLAGTALTPVDIVA
jgi:hypothetical protein